MFYKKYLMNLSTITNLTYLRESYLHAINNSSAFVGKTFGIGSDSHFLYSSSPHLDAFKWAQNAPKKLNESENNSVK